MSKNMPTVYAIIPADVRYHRKLRPSAKLLYGEIAAVSDENGYCHANNRYFAELFGTNIATVSKWITELVKYDFIDRVIIYKKGSKQVEIRYLFLKADASMKKKGKQPNATGTGEQ